MASYVRCAGHDSATWAGSSIAMPVGASTETWSFDAVLGGTVSSVYEVVNSFVSWANNGARAWSGSVMLSWLITEFDATGRTNFAINYAGATPSYVVSSGLQTLVSLPNTATGALVASAGARSSFNVQLRVSNFSQLPIGSGGITAAGSYFTGVFSKAKRRPAVSAVCTEAETYAISEAVAVAANPRQLYHYALVLGGWVLSDLGAVKITRKSRSFYTATLEVTK